MNIKPPTTKLQQRISLPVAFVLEAEADCQRIGLSLPISLGLAARLNWPAFLRSLSPSPALPAPQKARAAK